jgi:serine phosphatase RsbU (regulator of sigma subunit)
MKYVQQYCYIAYILILGFCNAQNLITIDAEKDSFYEQLHSSEDGYLFIPSSDYIAYSGTKPESNEDLSASIWTAWDSVYLYLYTEITDDIISVNQSQRYNNDCIELKFDPDPSMRVLYSVVNARLTALDTSKAKNITGVDNIYSEGSLDSIAASPENYTRRLTDNGYVLEFRLAWQWIRMGDRRIIPQVGTIVGLSISIHDNDGQNKESTIQWSAGMADEVYILTQLLGTIELSPENKIKLIRKNAIDPNAFPGKTYISEERFDKMPQNGFVVQNWRYHAGDDSLWREPDFDDHLWEVTSPNMENYQSPLSQWQGVGWFRTYIEVDSALWGRPLGLSIFQAGASEIYLNGKLLYRLGEVGTSKETEIAAYETIPRPIVFNKKKIHMIAIRYSNFSVDFNKKINIPRGIIITFWKDLNWRIENYIENIRTISIYQMIMTVVPFTLALVHLLIFFFYPKMKENLFYAFCMFGWTAISFFNFHTPFVSTLNQIVMVNYFSPFYVSFTLIFGLLTAYALVYPKLPRQHYGFIAIGLGLSILGIFKPASTLIGQLFNLFIGIIAIEIFRVIIIKSFKQKSGKWISGIGFIVLMLSIIYQILYGMGLLPSIGQYGVIYIYGVLFLSICISIDLSRTIARTNKNLEHQLIQVKELSRKTLEQERNAKEKEISLKVLEADNKRKTLELEEARALQLSMLPKDIPRLPHLDIEAYMKTATEVGGDYYDFKITSDDRLLIALGDATGHGMKAGTMVGITKGLFSSLDEISDLIKFFNRSTNVIRRMNLGNLYMALLLAVIEDHRLTLASAGMPPVLIFRHQSKEIEIIELKGMPLGAHVDFPYQQKVIQIHTGDTVFMMSDGLPELFNEQKEIFDYGQVAEIFRETAEKSPKEIINHLEKSAKSWQKSQPQNDDITFIVLKVK